MKQTAVEWFYDELHNLQFLFENDKIGVYVYLERKLFLKNKAKEMDMQKQDEFAIGFAEWYEEEILAKGNFNMIEKPKKQLLEIYKKEKGL